MHIKTVLSDFNGDLCCETNADLVNYLKKAIGFSGTRKISIERWLEFTDVLFRVLHVPSR